MAMNKKEYRKGQRVAWSDQVYMHGEGSVLVDTALPDNAQQGMVVGLGETPGTWEIRLDDGKTVELNPGAFVRITKERS